MAIGATVTTVNTYPTSHVKKDGEGGGGVTYIMGNVNNTDLPDNISVGSISAENGNIDYLQGKSLSYNDGQFKYIASNEGSISKLRGEKLGYSEGIINDLTSDTINTGKLKADEAEIKKAWIDTINSTNITTDYLTVTKQAHFFELIIDKMRSVGGTIIETAANCILDYVKAYDGNDDPLDMSDEQTILSDAKYFKVFWRAESEDNGIVRTVKNDWIPYDQALCQSFNNASTRVNYNVSNKYYWRLVKASYLDNEGKYLNFTTGEESSTPSVYSDNHVTIKNLTFYYNKPNPSWNADDPSTWTYTETATQDGVQVDTNDSTASWSGTITSAQGGVMSSSNIEERITINLDEAELERRMNLSSSDADYLPQSLINMPPTKLVFDAQIKIYDQNIPNTTIGTRLNIAVNYNDGTTQFFPAPAIDHTNPTTQTRYEVDLATNSTLHSVYISNADELQWHHVHSMILGNDNRDNKNEYAGPPSQDYTNKYSPSDIPSAGDNLAQLGYRYDNPNATDTIVRASAIIIAAYETPDHGNPNKAAIVPPSYAQYMGINDFDLATHRHSYFDASGAYFVGNFSVSCNVVDGSTSVPFNQYIDGHAPTYYLYTAYCDFVDGDPTHKDPTLYPNNVIHFSLSYDQNQAYMGIWSTTVSPQPTNPKTAVNYEWMYIQGSQGQQGPQGPAGPAGSHIEFAYANATNNPLLSGATTPLGTYPSEFGPTVATPTAGQFTWMTQSEWGVQGATYLTWNPAIRITGDKGATGADGTEIEFIYTRNNGNNGSPNPPAAPPSSFDPGPTGDTYNGVYWTNHPVGVAGATMYEYVCQRIKGPTGAWGAYQPSPAAVWSKWGEKGMDGDGYEYIYAVNDSDTEYPPITYTANRGKTSSDDDFVPIGWEDEPQTLSSSNKYEWVSTRKRENGGPWQNFTPPKIWAHWSDRGSQGPTGPQGPAGQDGQDGVNAIQYVLVDQGSVATVVASLDNNNNVTKQLIINLRYKVVVIEGATARYATMQEMRDFPRQAGDYDGCYAYCKMSLDQNNANYRYLKMNLNTNDTATSDALFTYTQQISNEYVINTNDVLVIALINYNAVNNQQNSISPTSANLQYTLYTTNMQITLAPSASLSILQGDHASISTLVTGQQNQSQQISQLQQTSSQISSTVSSHTTQINNINGDITNINNEISTIQQTSSSITSKVENLNTGSKNYFNYTFTQFVEGAVPYIQGYGLEVKGTASNGQRYSQVNNLDFDEKGGDFSVTCWMRMQATSKNVRVGLCNTNPNNITDNDGRVTVTTAWQKYSFTYNITDANTNVQNVNGHITFSLAQGDSFTDTNRLYVKYLMITRGNIPSDFNISWRDYDSVMTKQDALIVSDDMWNYISNLNKTANKFKGYDIYECAGSTVSSDTNYVDVINISGIQVKQNKIYTLSFYAKTDGSSSINNTAEATGLGRNAYMYNTNPISSGMGIDEASRQEDINNPIGHPSKGNKSDGATNYKLNNSWQQFIIHWYNQNSVLSSFIAMRLFGTESTTTITIEPFSIAGVEVREGWWDVDGLNSSSMIKQTADEIELKVKNTGINIDDGTITLSADNTFVDGNLVLKYNEGAQGLIFRNSSNQDGLKISTSNLPQLSTWLNEYPGYPKLDVATNGFGFQSGSRYLYASTSDLALHDGNAGGVNNEYQIDVTLRQDGGNIGQIKDYIGQTEFASNDTNTAYVKFLASETMVQHNGVRIIHPAHNYNYSDFQVTSKDKILLCAPNGNQQTSSELNQRAVTLNFPSNCVGHYYFIKRLYDVGRIYINGYVYAGTFNLSNTPMHNPYIDDNGLWMAIIVDGLDSTYSTSHQIILNKIANNDRPNID